MSNVQGDGKTPLRNIGKAFGVCSMCGKKLISYDPHGNIVYIFGDNLKDGSPIVNMRIAGSIMIQCTRKSCRRMYPEHWNNFNCFDDLTTI